MRLSAGVRDVWIDYTALSFAEPEKVRFRYKLEGQDADWTEVVNQRQVHYSNLGPHNYRFRVMACNNSGVWNETGASFDFSVAPAYYQTKWFLASCLAASVALLAGLYHLRIRYLKHQFNIRREARVGERTRIARDLQDTLLQSFQAVVLKFAAFGFRLSNQPELKKDLEALVEQARGAVTEARDAVQGLRSSKVIANDLARAIGEAGCELASSQGANAPKFSVEVDGGSRDLPPLIRDEVYRIACDALRNAFQHAHAGRIDVEIRYESRQFRLVVRDNGKGIDQQVLEAGGRAGHHGLYGINERAELAGGKLSVWSRIGSGTKVELTIPASIAYTKSPPPGGRSTQQTGKPVIRAQRIQAGIDADPGHFVAQLGMGE